MNEGEIRRIGPVELPLPRDVGDRLDQEAARREVGHELAFARFSRQGLQALEILGVRVEVRFAELARDPQQLLPVLVADSHGERHGHDAAGERRPESVQELLVVVEEDDDLVAALRAERLQVVQNSERTGVHVAVTHAPLGVLALDIGDDAVDIAIHLEQLHQSFVRHRTSTVIMRLERGRRLICASSSMG